MKSFELALVKTVEEAVQALPEQIGDDRARLMAGGQDLLTEMKEHLVEPEVVVRLSGIPGLNQVERVGDQIHIGALVTIAQLERDPVLSSVRGLDGLREAASSIASPQIRTQATVGGNLNQRPRCWYYRSEHFPCLKKGGTECYSYYGKNRYNAILGGGPSYIVHPSDLAPILIALEARVTLVSPSGERTLPLQDYYVLPSEGDVLRETRIAANEVLTRITIPTPGPGRRSTYRKFKEKESYDFAMGAVAAVHEADAEGVTRHLRLCLGAVAPIPWRCERTERKLLGRPLNEDAIVLAQEDALAEAQPLSENGYKIPLTKGLIAEALEHLEAQR